MHMFYQYLSICERPPGDKYIVYRILLLANFKHMFYQYLSMCERPPGHLTSRGWKTGRPPSTPPATLLVLYSNFIGVKWEKEALVPRVRTPVAATVD